MPLKCPRCKRVFRISQRHLESYPECTCAYCKVKVIPISKEEAEKE